MSKAISDEDFEAILNTGQVPESLRTKILTDPMAKQELAKLMLALVLPAIENGGSAENTASIFRMWPAIRDKAASAIAGVTSVESLPPMRLAASTVPLGQRSGEDRSATIHACFLNLPGGIGHIRPLVVDVADAPSLDVQTLSQCDANMQGAALRAAQGALSLLHHYGFHPADRSLRVRWIIQEEAPTEYSGASIGLALSIAIFAAVVGIEVPDDVCVTGAVDRGDVLKVEGAGRKWKAAFDRQFATMLLPADCSRDLPPDAFRNTSLRVFAVHSIDDAIKDLFNTSLGLSERKLAAATESETRAGIRFEFFPSRPSESQKRSLGRGVTFIALEHDERYYIGQEIIFNVRCSKPVHVAIFNIGASGNATMFLPNANEPDTSVQPGKTRSFGGLQLGEPVGNERFIAVASDRPIPLPSTPFPRFDPAQLQTEIDRLVGPTLARHEVGFRVYPSPVSSRSVKSTAPQPADIEIKVRKVVIADF